MSDADSVGYDQYPKKKGLRHEVRTMPRWKKILLALSLIVGLAGLGVQEASSVMKKTAPPTPTPPTHVAPGSGVATPGSGFVPSGSNGFVSGGQSTPTAADTASPVTPSTQSQDQTASEVMTPYMTRIGFSLFVGVVVGFIFRTFLRMAAGVTAVIIAFAVALSYFHVINVDMTEVKTQTASASAWIGDQAGRLKDMLFHALPSSTAAGAGFFFGFKRR